MIRKIMRMQCVKLFDSAEYVGFNLIGSILVIVFGWGVLSMGGGADGWREQFRLSMFHSFPALLMLCVCMSVYTFAREYENKTIYYEVVYGGGAHKMMIGRMLAPVFNAIIFTLVILGIEVILQCAVGGRFNGFSEGVTGRLFLNFVCGLHLNVISGLYFVGTGSVAAACVLIALTQWCFPALLENWNISNLLCAGQFRSLWGNEMPGAFAGEVLGSFFVEAAVVFVIVCVWRAGRDWK